MKILLIIYDNDSFVHFFPLGSAYIASALRDAGYIVEIYNQDVYHYSKSHLTDYLIENQFDVVGLGIIAGYYQYEKLLNISEAINFVPNPPFYILGGHGPTPEPEYFLKKTKADAIILGEGEISIVNLLDAIEKKKDLSSVKGIAFLRNKKLIVTQPQELIKDIDSISFPAWDLFPIDYYSLFRYPRIENNERSFPVLSGRGCPFKCNFCFRLMDGVRSRSPENIIKEIKILKEKYRISYIDFADELLMSSSKRIKELCKSFIEDNLNIRWSCNGRLNYATSKNLKVMKEAGCVFINYGIECVDNQILKNMNKKLTTQQITNGIESTLSENISPGYNIIFGNIGENKETLEKGVNFLLRYDDHSQLRTIRIVTPYPGSPLYYYAIEKGLLRDIKDFYENKHINSDLLSINFTNLSDEEIHTALFDANKKLLENYYNHLKDNQIEIARKLYFEKDATFRGFRQT